MTFMESTSRTFRLRAALGEPQHVFAHRIGCSQATVARLELGQPETGAPRILLDRIEATLCAATDHSFSPGAVPPAPTAALSEPVLRPDGAAFSSKVPA
jgi:transcriptional regulator with XRE-family HTH domain